MRRRWAARPGLVGAEVVSQQLTAACYVQNWIIRITTLPVGEWKILAKRGDVQVGFQKKVSSPQGKPGSKAGAQGDGAISLLDNFQTPWVIALSNLVYPHGWACSGQRFGLGTSQGPCWAEVLCTALVPPNSISSL